jgi:hypothetical protein
VDTLHLTITPQTGTATAQTACGTYTWNGTTYTASGTYTFANSACDVDTLHLTITPQTGTATAQTSCGTYTWNGTTYTTSGTYTFANSACDVDTLHLTITPQTGTATAQTSCGTYTWNGTTYTTSGTYTFANSACDVDTLHLTITPQTGTATTQTACGTYTWNGTTYTTSGTYTFANSACDVDTLHLTITPQTGTATAQTACGTYTWNGTTYTASGTYTFANSACDVDTLHLTITPQTGTATAQTSCGTYTWNGTTYTTSGTYTFANSACDVDTLHLTITPQTGTATTQTACGTYTWNGTTYTTSGTYTFANSACDVDTLHLTVTPQTGTATTQTSCGTYTWNGTTYTTSGTYTFANSACDVDTLHLTITTPFTAGSINSVGQIICDNSAPISVTSLTPASSGGVITYEWRANGVPIANSNSADYTPPSGFSGSITYTRWAKDNLCTSTFTQSSGEWVLMASYPFEVSATAGTVGPTFYNTISDVFNSINNGVHRGSVIVKVNCSSTSNLSASLNASGTGSSNYTSVSIYPSTIGVTISGSINSPLINFNGADNVTIDGRVNGTGTSKSLTISNTNTGNTASTIRYINAAENNTVKNTILSSSNRAANLGATIFLSTATGNGNSNISITDNTITTAVSAQSNRPFRSILSNGTEGAANRNVSILNNEFVDILNSTATSYGVRTLAGSSNWTISGNHFYQTDATFTPTDNNTYAMIDIANTTGNSFVVSNNVIGGRSTNAGGSSMNLSGAASSIFYGIRLSAGTSGTSSVESNIIKNIYHSSSNDIAFFGIRINDGNVNVNGNTIGKDILLHCPVVKATATATVSGGVVTSISLTNAGLGYTNAPLVTVNGGGGSNCALTAVVTNGQVGLSIANGGLGYTSAPTITINGSPIGRGIYLSGTGTIEANNNTISGILTSGSNANSVYSFYGIESASNAPRTINGNIIGSDSESSSIVMSNPTTSAVQTQSFYGIYSSTVQSVTINNNIIANVTNAAVNSVASVVRGIHVTAGTTTINSNVIHDLESASTYNNAIATNGTIVGIQNESTGNGTVQSIQSNKIYNLRSTATSADVRVRGIHFKGLSSGSHTISHNFIHSLSIASNSTSAQLFGLQIESGTISLTNNIINVGSGATNGTQVYGLWEAGALGSNLTIYHNTFVISGATNNTSTLTYAFFGNSASNTKNIRNNIFTNIRSSGSGSNLNFALRLSAITGTTIDYNNYFVNGTAGTILRMASTNHTTLTTWQTATSQDANAYNLNPGFATSPPTTIESHYVPLCGMNGASGLVAIDYNGTVRSNPTAIGAFEVNSRIPDVDNMTATSCSGAQFTVSPVNGVNGSVPQGITFSWSAPMVTGAMTGGASGIGASNISGSLTNTSALNQTATYTVTPTSGSCQGANFTVTLTIRPQINAGAISTTGETICAGGDAGIIASVTAASGPNAQIIYSWRSSVDNFTGAIDGASAVNYDPPVLNSTTTYRRYASDSECSTNMIQSAGEWVVTVGSNSQVTTISGPSVVCTGTTADLSIANTTGANQWQSSVDNQIFVNIANATGANYSAQNVTATTYFRVVITGGCAAGTTEVFTVSVNQPTINIQVNNTSITNGDYLWNGNISSDGSLLSNWYVYNNGVYSVATTLPTNQTKVFVVDYVNASTCVSEFNNANIPELGTFASNNLYIGSNAILTLSPNATINVSGDMIVNGTLNAIPTSTINFNGTGIQKISGTQPIVIDNLTVNKANGNLKLEAPVTVRGTLNMLDGNIVTTLTNILEIGSDNFTTGSINWVDGSVVGPLKRWFTNTTNSTQSSGIFPVGNEGVNRYAQVNFTAPSADGGYLIVAFKDGLAPDAYSNFPLQYNEGNSTKYIQNSDQVGYWEMTPYSASGQMYGALDDVAYTLRLRINVPTSVAQGGHILNDPPGIRLIRAKGNAAGGHEPWTLAGTYSQYVYNSSSDVVIESTGVEGFSWFNGGGNNDNPLPVELLSFAGECIEKDHVLTWQTASEHNSESFEVQSSRDGVIWNTVNTQVAAGNSNSLLSYNFIHSNVGSDSYYYRLNQIDFNGESKTYDPILVYCASSSSVLMTYPNPSNIGFNLIVKDDNLVGTTTITITDSKGSLVSKRSVEILDGTNMIRIEEPLAAGMYYLQLQNGTNSSIILKHVIH